MATRTDSLGRAASTGRDNPVDVAFTWPRCRRRPATCRIRAGLAGRGRGPAQRAGGHPEAPPETPSGKRHPRRVAGVAAFQQGPKSVGVAHRGHLLAPMIDTLENGDLSQGAQGDTHRVRREPGIDRLAGGLDFVLNGLTLPGCTVPPRTYSRFRDGAEIGLGRRAIPGVSVPVPARTWVRVSPRGTRPPQWGVMSVGSQGAAGLDWVA